MVVVAAVVHRDTVTVRSGPSDPTPLKTSTLRPLHIAAMPADEAGDDLLLALPG